MKKKERELLINWIKIRSESLDHCIELLEDLVGAKKWRFKYGKSTSGNNILYVEYYNIDNLRREYAIQVNKK
jgi:hypothetical protein